MSLRCRSQVRGDSVILSLSGMLDGAGRLEEAVGGLLRRCRRPLVIDLGGLWGWTEAGQLALATAARRSAVSGNVVLCSVPGHLRITDRQLITLPRHHTLTSALASLRGRTTPGEPADPGRALPAGVPVGPGATCLRHAVCTLAAQSRSVRRARSWAHDTLTGWGLPAAAERAVLPLSEVATNALLYGRSVRLHVALEFWQTRDGHRLLVVGVQDGSPHPPVLDDPDPDGPALGGPDPDGRAPGGWGLGVLMAVTDTCGWYRRTDGPGKSSGSPSARTPSRRHRPTTERA